MREADTLNQLDIQGKRTGYWVVDEGNDATTLDSKSKRKEVLGFAIIRMEKRRV